MKKSLFSSTTAILFVVFLFNSFDSFAQSGTKVDQRLYDVYETSHIENLKVKNPELLKYYTYFLDNSYYILDLPAGKENAYQSIYNVKAAEIKGQPSKENFNEDPAIVGTTKFNPLKYEFIRDKSKRIGYKLGKQNKAVIFYSEDEFSKMFNEIRIK